MVMFSFPVPCYNTKIVDYQGRKIDILWRDDIDIKDEIVIRKEIKRRKKEHFSITYSQFTVSLLGENND